jgi:UTP--glucose-1-phosphate uridylyltransferase
VGDNPFAVLLGDDLIDPRDPLLQKMIAVRDSLGGSVVALLEVPREQIHLYGCAAVEAIEGGDDPDTVRVVDLVEKPSIEEAPSTYAVIGRYVLDPAVFGVLESTQPGRGGEIQLTDALRTLARDVDPADGGGVTGIVFRGRRYDTGDRMSYLQTVVRLACERDDLGPELVAWLKEFVATL